MLIVPEKTIAAIPVVPIGETKTFNKSLSLFLNPLNKTHKREWFDQHFYKCLPLSIGNMQGFIFSLPYSFSVIWNGEMGTDAITIELDENAKDFSNYLYLQSEFGRGILTAHFPVILKTPKDVNLMTIAPPNYPIPGISPMTGVVESDNLRFTFTLNFKIDLINTKIVIEKDYPIMGIIPIPRNYCDSFELKDAYDILNHDDIEEERQIAFEHGMFRKKSNEQNLGQDGLYYRGLDIKNNEFHNHQLPKNGKK